MEKVKKLAPVWVLPILFFILVAGCGGRKVRMGDSGQVPKAQFSFLKDGRTTKSEIISRLGQHQDKEFEDGRILIYILDKNYKIVRSGDSSRYHLILVFDAGDRMTLTRHSLVRIR